MSTSSDCCEGAAHPRSIDNPPGRASVAYRVGDYASFRRALLEPRPKEVALAGWHPSPGSDLGLQLLEWWAYLADILTFYNERALQETLLGTATLPESSRRIVRLLGYRPRPGIGATGVVAALTDALDPFVLPRGFEIDGTVIGQDTQVFELDEDIEIGRVGRPLPRSARFPAFKGTSGTAGAESSSGDSVPGPQDDTSLKDQPADIPATLAKLDGRLLNGVGVTGGNSNDDSKPPAAGEPAKVSLDGVIASVKPGDTVLIVKRNWAGHLLDPLGYALATVKSVNPVFDHAAPANTGIEFVSAHDVPAPITECRVMRATKLSHLWLYHQRYPGSANLGAIGVGMVAQVVETIFDPLGLFHSGPPLRPPEDPRVLTGLCALGSSVGRSVAHLEAITRGINPGDLVLFEKRTGGGLAAMFDSLLAGMLPPAALAVARLLTLQLVKVSGYAEDIWYGNAPELDRIGVGPPIGPPGHGIISGGEGPIPIPHSRLIFDTNPFLDVMALGDLDIDKVLVHYGWEDLGEQVVSVSREGADTVEPDPLPDQPPGANVATPALVVDSNGKGTYGWLGQKTRVLSTDGSETSSSSSVTRLTPPLQALINLLPISRGKSVPNEVLGSGDPTLVHQEFALRQFPLTYLASTGPRSNDGYESTLRVRVDGVDWTEVRSFYGQPPDARIFVTREDDEQRTHVRFGDGEHGARLPAGTSNVVARYRYGSGAAVPPAGALTTIPKPFPGLTSVANPVQLGGGADPEPPSGLRRYAPRSVLTFGRAISGDDYETLAAQTPGVSRARASWDWDVDSQRALVKVFVGDDDAAVAAAWKALGAFGDPNRPVRVVRAEPVLVDLTLRVLVDPAYDTDAVRTAVSRLLLDPEQHPFGAGVVRIGEPIYDSQIYDACRRVPGVAAIHGLRFGVVVSAQAKLKSKPLTGLGQAGQQQAQQLKPPLIPDPKHVFGETFIPADLDDPVSFALRLGLAGDNDLSDPMKVASNADIIENWSRAFPDPSTGSPTDPPPIVTVEASERHVPGKGRFYRLEAERLHLSAEVTRHVL